MSLSQTSILNQKHHYVGRADDNFGDNLFLNFSPNVNWLNPINLAPRMGGPHSFLYSTYKLQTFPLDLQDQSEMEKN